MDTLPSLNASYEVPVRQTSVLPSASFRHPLTSLPLPLANASPYRAHRGLAPPSISALPGTPQRNRLMLIYETVSAKLIVSRILYHAARLFTSW